MLCCSANQKHGFAVHIYTANQSMKDCCLANADGDMLIVPQQGRKGLWTGGAIDGWAHGRAGLLMAAAMGGRGY